jgi:acetyltransferase-like isoleucine patch superfamily enzyme
MYTLTIGKGTIFHNNDPHIIDYGLVNTNIVFGNYTMIGPNLTIFAGGSEHYFKGVAVRLTPPFSKGDVRVGNGVWIGYGVTIFTGVTIGDGAVIGACSVVGKDIPPYAVAYGNPIKVKRYRFDCDTITKLLSIAWWDRGESFINENADLLFDESKVQLFIKRCGL